MSSVKRVQFSTLIAAPAHHRQISPRTALQHREPLRDTAPDYPEKDT